MTCWPGSCDPGKGLFPLGLKGPGCSRVSRPPDGERSPGLSPIAPVHLLPSARGNRCTLVPVKLTYKDISVMALCGRQEAELVPFQDRCTQGTRLSTEVGCSRSFFRATGPHGRAR